MVIIRRMTDADRVAVLQLAVLPEQKQFVGEITDILDALQPTEDPHVIVDDKTIVGFFLMDRAYHESYDFAWKNDIGFRSYFIDHRHQGKGYAKASLKALRPYLKQAYPIYSAVVLTVNCKNPAAIKLYLNNGFEDTGALYHGGTAGPQHIMRMGLDDMTSDSL